MPQTLEQIADAFEAAGQDPFSTDLVKIEAWRKANPDKDRYAYPSDGYLMHDTFPIDRTGLPENWPHLVHNILKARRDAVAAAKIAVLQAAADAEFAKLPEALQIAANQHRHLRIQKPNAADLSFMCKLATDQREPQYGKGTYKPVAECGLRLKLKEAVQIAYIQDSYADYSRYLIPVTGERPADLSACRRNLGAFCAALRTTNGLAGFGSSWDMELIDTSAGLVVLAVSRSSISD